MTGVFHWSGKEQMTKYDMAITMAESFNLPTQQIVADRNPSGGALRPFNSQLSCDRLKNLGIGNDASRSFKAAIKNCLQQFLNVEK